MLPCQRVMGEEIMAIGDICECGCGQKVVAGKKTKRFVDRFHYGKWYRENKHKLNGYKCTYCKTPLMGAKKKWCRDNCRSKWVNQELQKKKVKEAKKSTKQHNPPKHKPKNRAEKNTHLTTYCIQDQSQCALYQPFSIMEEIEGERENCMGKNFTGSCFVPPEKKSEASRTSCVNLLYTKL